MSGGIPTVFVIIVTYKGKVWYDRCFQSLRESTMSVRIIVIDNASNDGSVDYIKENYPEIYVIESDKNLGFGGANNIGLRYALDHGCDYCFLLNQDAWIEPDTIAGLVNIAQAHPSYGILSPIHLTKEKDSIEKLLLRRLADPRTTDSKLFDDVYFGRPKDLYWTKYVNAAAWFLPRKTLEMVGGFDPIFFHYGEDDNYINRVFYHGLEIGICPKLCIVHDNDRPRPLYDNREHDVLMMIEYTNVNHYHDLKVEMRRHLFKAVKGFIRGRKKASRHHLEDYSWLKKHWKALENSVSANRNRGENWL